jgi:3-methyladenine DNA glycosylase/8-oxoguanine DNA glycosylase
LPREAAAKRLREIYGVGPATAWYLLFESLKHLDAFDHVSPWEQKVLSRLLFDRDLVPPEHILAEARKRWGQWRMLAVHYIFEDLFWRHKNDRVEWLDALIRL